MNAPDKYLCEPQQRVLRLITVLAGHEITGLSNGDVARDLGCSPSVAVRDLANLQLAGLAEKVPETDRWRLAPQLVQLAMQHMVALHRAHEKLAELTARYGRGTNPVEAARALDLFTKKS